MQEINRHSWSINRPVGATYSRGQQCAVIWQVSTQAGCPPVSGLVLVWKTSSCLCVTPETSQSSSINMTWNWHLYLLCLRGNIPFLTILTIKLEKYIIVWYICMPLASDGLRPEKKLVKYCFETTTHFDIILSFSTSKRRHHFLKKANPVKRRSTISCSTYLAK